MFAIFLFTSLCVSASGQEQSVVTLKLSVEEAVKMARLQSSAVAQAEIQASISKAAIMAAEGNFDPVIFSDLSYSLSESEASGFFSTFGNIDSATYSAGQGIRKNLRSGGTLSFELSEGYDDVSYLTDSQSNTSATMRFNQPLLRGAFSKVATAEERKAILSHKGDMSNLAEVAIQSEQSVVEAYWSLVFALADLEVKQRSLDLAISLRETTLAKIRVGAMAEVEVLQTEADIALREEALLGAKNLVENSTDALRRFLFNFEESDDWTVEFDLTSGLPAPSIFDGSWQDLWAEALESRGEFIKLKLQIESAELDLLVAESNVLPKLDFTASGTYTSQSEQIGDSLDLLLDRQFPGYTLGISFELPLGNKAFLGAKDQAKYRLLLLQRQWRDRGSDLAQEVRAAVNNFNYQADRVELSARTVLKAEKQLEAEQRKLAQGASTNYQVLQFQSDLAVALSQRLQAQTEFAKAKAKIKTLQGQTTL